MNAKEARQKLRSKVKKEEYLHAHVSWGGGMRSFRIVNSKNYETIAERNLYQNGKQCWFNLQNVKSEVKQYADKLGLKTELSELYACIDRDGFSYSKREEVDKRASEKGILLIE